MNEEHQITSEDIEYFKQQKELAYQGKSGEMRKEFCIDYIKTKKRAFDKLHMQFTGMIKERGEEITCHKGCSTCCILYIEASVNECELIVYYLYDNMYTFFTFLEQYPEWRRRIGQYGDPLLDCELTVAEMRREDRWTDEAQHELDRKLLDYQILDVPCPFLHNDICIIHEVRPYACANHLVTSPAEWCSPFHPARPMLYRGDKTEEMNDLTLYGYDLEKPVISSMPLTVYEILRGGLPYISELTGIKIPEE
ncbi:hypothetical protein ACFLYN_05310 [Chloroflexota bacterium]